MTTDKKIRPVWLRDIKRDIEREWLGIALPGTLKIEHAHSTKVMGHTVRTVVYSFDTSSGMRLRFGVWIDGRLRYSDKVANVG